MNHKDSKAQSSKERMPLLNERSVLESKFIECSDPG